MLRKGLKETAMGTYVVVAFWVACYYFFSGMFPMWHFAAGSMPGLAGWPIALLIGFLLIVAKKIIPFLLKSLKQLYEDQWKNMLNYLHAQNYIKFFINYKINILFKY